MKRRMAGVCACVLWATGLGAPATGQVVERPAPPPRNFGPSGPFGATPTPLPDNRTGGLEGAGPLGSRGGGGGGGGGAAGDGRTPEEIGIDNMIGALPVVDKLRRA